MKHRITNLLQPGSGMFYVLFLLFAACGLYFSIPYGLIGMAACIILRVISVHSDSERRRRIQMLMDKIVIDGINYFLYIIDVYNINEIIAITYIMYWRN